MKNLNLKLFITAVVFGVIEVALFYYFGIKGVTPLPQWGMIALGGVGAIMTMSLALFIIRKLTGAEKWD